MSKFMSLQDFTTYVKNGEKIGVPRTETYERLRQNGWSIQNDPNPLPPQPKPISPYASEVANDITSSVKTAGQNLAQIASDYHSGKRGFLTSVFQGTGALSGGVANVLASPFAPIASRIGQAVTQIPGVKDVVQSGAQAVQDFSQAHPETARNIKAAGQIVSLPLAAQGLTSSVNAVGKGVEALGKGTINVGSDILKANPLRKDFDQAISIGVDKGIKPQFRGAMRNSPTALRDYKAKAGEAVQQIIDNKNAIQYVDEAGDIISDGHAPRSLNEFAQAIEQTKKNIYQQYAQATADATGQGLKIDLHDVAQKLMDYADDPVKQLADSAKTTYAKNLAADLLRVQELDPKQVENLISELNQSLARVYADKTVKGVSEVDLSVANALRDKLDSTVLDATGTQYQSLKNAYGALKTIEKDVGHRALISARQNMKGLTDLTDIFTGGDLATGIITGNPALVTRGAVGKGISSYYKYINSPDTQIMRMFSRAQKALSTPSLTPEEVATGLIGGSDVATAFTGIKDAEKVLYSPTSSGEAIRAAKDFLKSKGMGNPDMASLIAKYGSEDNIPMSEFDILEKMRVDKLQNAGLPTRPPQ